MVPGGVLLELKIMQESIYDPGFAAFGGGSSGSVLHPIVLGAVGAIAVLTFTLKRKYVVVPLLLGMLLIPFGQNFYIGGFHLFTFRLLVLLGCTRVAFSGLSSKDGFFPGGLNILDKFFLTWAIYRALATILLYREVGAAVNQAAFLWDALGAYFLLRGLIENEEDIGRAVKVLAVVAVVAAAGMLYEQFHGQNFFGFLGGVRPIPEMREGRVRSQAVFGHALLAGAFGATTFVLFIWLWKKTKTWLIPFVGMAAALVMVYAASTSTPLMALIGGIFALCLWPVREHMRLLRWGIVAGIVSLHLVMKAPVWYVLAHIDLSGGSTGAHRAELIDNFIRHFFDWWLIGTHDNVNWGWDMWDQCNQYILEGENGGLIAFVCFIAMFVICYRWIGMARKASVGDKHREWLFWILGAAFFAQSMAFFGVDYFDQTKAVWYFLLVTVVVATRFAREPAFAPAAAKTEERALTIRKPWEPLPAHQGKLEKTLTKLSLARHTSEASRHEEPERSPGPGFSSWQQWRKR